MALVECVPNFSEGRRMEVVSEIVAAIQAAGGRVLDQTSDRDHNRSVVTFVAEPQTAVEAAFAGIRRATELINLDQHSGEHPRVGAADVVPFVPIEGITLQECAALARQLGERVGEELGIPVYLYEAAATRAERRNLEAVRQGGYEGLKESIGADANRAPDFGPARLTPAGATIIGARPPLIAFNVYLTTSDVDIAKKIAAAVRASSGGFQSVKGLGLLVEGRAQVSMNLTDYTRSPLARVVEAIRREAERYGAGVHHCELVGLIPQAALVDAARWYLQLDQFETTQVLETRLAAAQAAAGAPSFLDQLASAAPTPGGGSAAAHAGAMAAALCAMVARLTQGKKKYAGIEARMAEIALEAEALRSGLERAAAEDARAFDAVMAATKLPRETEAQRAARQEALERATEGAAAVPLEVMRKTCRVLELLAEAAQQGNVSAITDAGSGAALARAALTAAALNVRVNAASLAGGAAKSAWLQEVAELNARAQPAQAQVEAALQTRASLPE